jgi:hypothetical protein
MRGVWEEAGSVVPDRIYELADDSSAKVRAAVEAFTVPCKLCVPGARKQGQLVPFWFVVEGHEEDEYEDDDQDERETPRPRSRFAPS